MLAPTQSLIALMVMIKLLGLEFEGFLFHQLVLSLSLQSLVFNYRVLVLAVLELRQLQQVQPIHIPILSACKVHSN